MLLAAFSIALGIALLYGGGEWLIDGSVQLARRLRMRPIVIGLTVIAFGTSAPELAATLAAALEGAPEIGFGNVVGSNIANVGLILGIAALIRHLPVAGEFLIREMPFMLGTGFLMMLLVVDGRVARVEGLVLVALLLGYLWFLLRSSQSADPTLAQEYAEEVAEEPPSSLGWSVARIAGGILALVAGAHFLVDGAVTVARALGVAERVIGLTLVAFGTSLPELASAVAAALKREGDLLLGNIVGSNIFNVLAILGLTSTIAPMPLGGGEIWIDLAVMIGFSLALWPMLYTKGGLQRWEGALLVAGYVAYIGWLFV